MVERRFRVGDEIVLIPPSDDDIARQNDQWNEDMDLYAGCVGQIVEVYGTSEISWGYAYKVDFETKFVGERPVRNFWYLKEEWCESSEINGTYNDLDMFISEFCLK